MATFYVSAQTGNDSNNGTAVGTAKATVQAGIDLMDSAGDVLYIAPGTYYETISTAGAVAGTSTNKQKVIGDTDCVIFTTEEPGVVRISQLSEHDINETNTSTGTFYITRAHFEVHKLHIDGGGAGPSTNYNTSVTGYGFRASVEGYGTAYNCISQATGYAYSNMNAVNSIALSGFYGFASGNKVQGCIAIAAYAPYTSVQRLVDCIGLGGGVGVVFGADDTENCLFMGGSVGARVNTNDPIKNTIIQYCNTAIQINSGNQGDMGISGSFIQGCLTAFSKVGADGVRLGGGVRRLASSTSTKPNDSGWTIGDNNVTYGPAILYSYNQLWKLAEILKPDLLMPYKGTANVNHTLDADTHTYIRYGNSETDILGHPKQMGESTASLHLNADMLSANDMGPWEYSDIDITSSFSSSTPGIKITGEGVQSFQIPVYSGSAMTASVGAKWISAHDTVKPGLVLTYAPGYQSSSLYGSATGTGTDFHSGSQLQITSSYGTAAANTFETIQLAVGPSTEDQIYQLQLRAGNTGSSNVAVFSDLVIQ